MDQGQDWFSAPPGQKLIPGEQDLVTFAGIEIYDAAPPIELEVHLCVVDSGVTIIEAVDGREEEILDDSVSAYVLGYLVEVDDEGTFQVAAEFNVVPITEDLSLCDEYL